MNTSIPVTIKASVKTVIQLGKDETVEQAMNREVDIYLHGFGHFFHAGKEDLGADSYTIEESGKEACTSVDKELLNALIVSYVENTDLDSLYDSEGNIIISVDELLKLVSR